MVVVHVKYDNVLIIQLLQLMLNVQHFLLVVEQQDKDV